MELIAPAVFFGTLGLMLLMRAILSRSPTLIQTSDVRIVKPNDLDDDFFDLATELEAEAAQAAISDEDLGRNSEESREATDEDVFILNIDLDDDERSGLPARRLEVPSEKASDEPKVPVFSEKLIVARKELVLDGDEFLVAKAVKIGSSPVRKRARTSRAAKSEKRWWVQVIISGVVLAAALALIFTRRDDAEAQKWAFGTVGLILGFWLKA